MSTGSFKVTLLTSLFSSATLIFTMENKDQISSLIKSYLELNWSLIPILPDTKRPPIKWAKYQETRATFDEVMSWVEKGWYLAVVTGDISGVCVIDDDRVKHGLPEYGFDSPVISQSKSGGKHYYFKYDREIHTHCNGTLKVDLKGWHSYCLIPPFNGRFWLKSPKNLPKIETLPIETEELIRSDMLEKSDGKPLEIKDFVAVEEGSRSNDFYRIACKIFNDNDYDTAHRILYGINQTYLPPLDQKEYDYNVARAYKFVQAHPQAEAVPVRLDNIKVKGAITSPKVTKEVQIVQKSEFMAMEFPQHVWLLDKLLRADGLNMVIGESGVGKSLICLTMAKAITEGTFWVNEEFKASKKKVLILDKENSAVDLQNHMRSLGIDSDDFYIYMAAENFNVMNTKCELTPEALYLQKFLQDNEIDVIIMDSMTDFYIGEENSAPDATANIQAWKRLFGSRCLLTIHHENKPQQGIKKSTMNRARGSSNIVAQANSIISVSSTEEHPELITVEHAKVRGAKKRKPFQIEMLTHTEYISNVSTVTGFKFLGDITPAQLVKDRAYEAVLEFLKKDANKAFTADEIKLGVVLTGFGENAIKGVFHDMKNDPSILITGAGVKGSPHTYQYRLDLTKELEKV